MSKAQLLSKDQLHAICLRYTQVGSLNAVAKEYGISVMRVKRIWEKLSEVDRQAYKDQVVESRREVGVQIIENDTNTTFINSSLLARNAAFDELNNRLTTKGERDKISTKDLIQACKTLADIVRDNDTPSDKTNSNVFNTILTSINNDINIHIQDGKAKS